MKSIFIAAISMIGITIMRMILSVAFTDQVGEVLARVSVSILFFYSIFRIGRWHKNKLAASTE